MIAIFDKQLLKSKTGSPSYVSCTPFQCPFLTSGIYNWLPKGDKIILNQAPLLENRLRLVFQLAKRFCVLVFPKFDFDRLGLISISKVWHFWQHQYNQAWPHQLLPLAIYFVHCLVSIEPHHRLENFVACHSISVWTGRDTKIPFSTLPKTHLLCAGFFSTSVYWKFLAVQKL